MIDGCLHACMPVLSGVLRKCMKSASYLNPACRVFLPPPRRPGNATQSGRYFTHFLPQKYAPLSIVYWFTTVHHDLAFFNIQQLPKTEHECRRREKRRLHARAPWPMPRWMLLVPGGITKLILGCPPMRGSAASMAKFRTP